MPPGVPNTRPSQGVSLRSQFPGAQVFEQSILDGGWVRRIFQLGSPEIDDWAVRHMQPLAVPSQPSVVA